MKNVYTDNYKILMKEIEEDINYWDVFVQVIVIDVDNGVIGFLVQ